MRGGIGDFIEQGIEDTLSPVGLLSAALVPVTGGASLGLRGAAGVGARLATRAAGEVAVGAASGFAGRKVGEAIPEDAPGVLRIGGALLGGAVAGGITSSGIRRAVGSEIIQMNPRQLQQVIQSTSSTPEAAELATLISKAKRVPKSVVEAQLSAERARQLGAAERGFNSVGANAPGGVALNTAKGAAKGELQAVDLKFGSGSAMSIDLPVTLQKQLETSALLDVAEKWEAQRALFDLLGGSMPTASELDKLEVVFGPSIRRALDLSGGNVMQTMKAMNAPRALVASADLSAPFRQGIMLAASNPRQFFGNIKGMVRAFGDEDYYNTQVAYLHARPEEMVKRGFTQIEIDKAAEEATRARKATLALTDSMGRQEEQFIGALGLGRLSGSFADRLMQGSERSYTLYLNTLRRHTFNKLADNLTASGQATNKNLKAYAGFLNAATGRGPSAVLDGNLGKLMNAMFFAPGYTASRFVAPSYLWRAEGPVRRQVMKDMGMFVGSGTTALTLLAIAGKKGIIPGLSVESDPRSSDFGKIQYNNTRYDFWGGYQQIARNTIQAATGTRRTRSGEITEQNRMDTLLRFGRSKLAPGPGLGADLLQGETYLGKQIDLTDPNAVADDLVAERFLPLSLQDLHEGYMEGGGGGALMALPGMVGVGTQSFLTLSEVKDDLAEELFGKSDYGELTGAERQVLEQHPRFIDKTQDQESQGDNNFRSQTEGIETELTQTQQVLYSRLVSGTLDNRGFADAITDAQLRAVAKRNQAAEDFGIIPGDADSPMAIALQGWYALSSQADLGYADGIETGQRDWELYSQLEADYLSNLSPEERLFIDNRARRSNAPEVQWFYDSKDYITDSGYYDTRNAGFERYGSAVRRSFPEVSTFGDLQMLENNAILNGDTRLYKRVHAFVTRIESFSRNEHERMRRRDPQLDASLWLSGSTTKFLSRQAEQIARDSGLFSAQ